MKRIFATLAAVLALASTDALAWEKQFRDAYVPEGCTTDSCRNPYNEKFNAAWSKGDMKTALKYCREISRGDTPALPMPDAFIACAESGSVRKMGALAIYYEKVDPQPEKMFYWAKKGAVLKDGTPYSWNGGTPHPDSRTAWRQLCKAYHYGIGTPKNEGAYSVCYTVAYEQARDSVVADPESAAIAKELFERLNRSHGYAHALEVNEKVNLLRETRESYQKTYGNPY